MNHLILLTCATCQEDAEAADTHVYQDEIECGTCKMGRRRRERIAYDASVAEEDRRAEERITRHQQRTGSMQPGGLLREQAS